MDIGMVFRLSLQIVSFLLLLDGLGDVCTKGDADIKIVDAAARSHFPPMTTSEPKVLSLRVKPANVSGPPHLQQLAGQCFSTSEMGYTYEVCPFQNVTQKEDRISWNSFYGVLGVWREWVIANDTFTGMKFAVGEKCGSKEREVEVLFNCSTITRVHNITEPRTCCYTVWLDSPLACFKGAMQVYHVLSAGELEKWDQLELEFYSGEITFQGLAKRRKKLLIGAGLQHDPERKEILIEEKQTEPDHEPLSPSITNPIVKCVTEKLHLEKELKELKDVIEQVVSDHPVLASKFSFLKNTSNSTSTATPHTLNGSEEPSLITPLVTEDERVTDEQQAADVHVLKDKEEIIDAIADQNTQQDQQNEDPPAAVADAQMERHREEEADRVDKDQPNEDPPAAVADAQMERHREEEADRVDKDQPNEDPPAAVADAQMERHREEEADHVDKDEKPAPVVHALKTDPVRQRLEKLQGLDNELRHVTEVPKTPPVHPPASEVVRKGAENKAQGDSKETANQTLQELLKDVELQDILNEP